MHPLRDMPPGSRPAELDAADAVLGAIMVWPQVLDEITQLHAEDFYRPGDATIYAAARDMWRAGTPPDVQSLAVALERAGTLEGAGGRVRLADLASCIPSKANVRHHAKLLTDAATQRALVRAGYGVADLAMDGSRSVDAMRSEADRLVSEAFGQRLTPRAAQVGDITAEVLDWINQPDRGMSTGIPDLDAPTSGLQPEELTLLAARPSMGKTALCVRILRNLAVQGTPCALFSLEVPKRQIVVNLAAQELGISALRIRKNELHPSEANDFFDALEVMRSWPLTVDDTPGLTVEDVVSTARMLVRERGVRVVAVDYVQLLQPSKEYRSKAEEVGAASTRLKNLARELGIAVLATAQINRTAETRKNARPLMSDLKDSGNLEQDADAVWLLYRPEYYERDNEEVRGLAYVLVAKNRNGPTGDVELRFRRECMLFEPPMPDWRPRGRS